MITTSLKATILRLTIAMTFVVTIGGSALAQGRFGVGRFTWEGALYPAFGGTGLVTTDFPAASETVTGMAIDSAGRLIVVGYNTSGVWLVASYSPSTGVTGPELRKRRPRTDGFPRYAVARAVAVAANGDIVVAGHYSSVNGRGDVSALLDPAGQDLFLYFSQYSSDRSEQGVAVARLAWDRDAPRGGHGLQNGAWLPARSDVEAEETLRPRRSSIPRGRRSCRSRGHARRRRGRRCVPGGRRFTGTHTSSDT